MTDDGGPDARTAARRPSPYPPAPDPSTSNPPAPNPPAPYLSAPSNGFRPRPGPARGPDPDFARFLAASEPQAGDDEPERRRARHRAAIRQADPDARPQAPQQPKGPGLLARYGRQIVRLAVVVVVVVGAIVALRSYVVSPYYIPSPSMEPTLHGCPGCDDDHILVDKIGYRFSDPSRTDVVVFDRPANWNVTEDVLVKRVVATGGERIHVLDNGQVFVDGKRLDEPYVNPKCGGRNSGPLTSTDTWNVPDDQVFVMGDNRCDSADSRAFGPIPMSSIIGRAWLIVWPLDRFGSIGS